MHISNFSAGAGQLWIYASGDPEPVYSEGPFSAQGPFGDGDFWTGLIPGAEVTLEFLETNPPSGDLVPPFQVASIEHIWDLALPRSAAAQCEADVSCYPNYVAPARGVVFLIISNSNSVAVGVCTGAMINTRASSFKPYLLTANHCVNSDTVARSVVAIFSWQTAACNGQAPSLLSLLRIIGGRYLAGAPTEQGDYALLLMNQDPPAGTTFLGWNTNDPAIGSALTGIHHPDGDVKKISFGARAADAPRVIGGHEAPANLYYQASWDQGRVEPGSSGSPLLNAAGQIVGVLSGAPEPPTGLTVCNIDPFLAAYGRFSTAYPALTNWLEDTASLTVNPTSLVFTAINSQFAGPAQQSFTISTASTTAIPFTVSPSVPWIRVTNASGSVSASAPASINVSVDLSYFTVTSTITGNITVTSGSLPAKIVTVRANVTVVPASNVTITVSPNPAYQQQADTEGFRWRFTVTLRETAGTATTLTAFKVAGADVSTNITAWFGSNQIPARGALVANLGYRDIATPAIVLFEAGGRDSSTRTWSARISGTFLGSAATISSVNSGSDYGGSATFASGSWLEIKGTALAESTRTWRTSDFQGANAPTSLDGVGVSINGKPAFVYYVSPTQINAQAPADAATGPVAIRVTGPTGTSNAFTVSKSATAPGILAQPLFLMNGKQYMTAILPNSLSIAPARPAQPGDELTSFGIGFGETIPSVGPGVSASQLSALAAPFTLSFGETQAEVTYAGLAPGFIGLYQFNYRVPDVPDGDHLIKMTLNGQPLQQIVYLAVQR